MNSSASAKAPPHSAADSATQGSRAAGPAAAARSLCPGEKEPSMGNRGKLASNLANLAQILAWTSWKVELFNGNF